MNWPHIHLMLNHVPVLGTMFGLALLVWGYWRRDVVLQRAALVTFVVSALVALPVYLTGEPAEDAVEHLAGVADRVIETHEAAALVSFIAAGILGVLGIAGLLFARSRFSATIVRGALVVAVVTAGLMAWTANLGGRIRHSEISAGGRGAPSVEEHEEGGEGH